MAVIPEAESWSRSGSDVGLLLCHGFTGSPQGLRGWAENAADAGLSVELPRLPGHGTTWQDMNTTTWRDWYGTVDAALGDLAGRCRAVVVAGLSMGGALALRLALERPGDVAGLVLVNPAVRLPDRKLLALPLLRRLTPSFPGIGSDIKKAGSTELCYDRVPLHALASMLELYRDVDRRLEQVTQPVLLLHSVEDHVVHPSNSRRILDRVASADTTEILLHDSFHVATLDNDAERIVKESLAFVGRVAGGDRS